MYLLCQVPLKKTGCKCSMSLLPQGAKFLHPDPHQLLRQSQLLCQRLYKEHRAPHTRACQSPTPHPCLQSIAEEGCVPQQGCPDQYKLLLPSSSHPQALFHQCQWISAGEGQPGDFGMDKCCTGWPTLLCAEIARGTSASLSLSHRSLQMEHVCLVLKLVCIDAAIIRTWIK